jgi:antitoxin (DNA-binding transcriptional repressor) of toxin-antitoxin stability system
MLVLDERSLIAMSTVALEEAKAHLEELVNHLQPGESIVITRDQKPVAQLTATGETIKLARRLGSLRGTILSMASDFDAPLEDFKEYME